VQKSDPKCRICNQIQKSKDVLKIRTPKVKDKKGGSGAGTRAGGKKSQKKAVK
jgi:hypothetical protein